MKKLLSLLAAFALVLTLAGCGDKKEADSTNIAIDDVTAEQLKGVEINFWSAQGKEAGEAIEALTKKFNDTNEWGIHVTTTYQGNYNDTFQKTMAALQTPDYPHVAMAYGNNIEAMRESGKVVQINPLLDSKWGMSDAEFKDIVPAFRDEIQAFPDGNIYALPIGKSAELLYYNVEFFNERGLEVPTTWDELVALCEKVYAETKQPVFGYDSLDNYFITYLQQLGGKYTDDRGEILFRDGESYDAAVEVLAKYKDGWDKGYFTFKQEEYLNTLLMSGKLPMFIGSTSSAAYMKGDLVWATAPIPTMGEMKVMQQGAPVCLLDHGTVENLAAYLFVEFMMEAENTAYYAQHTGYVPVRTSSNEVPEYKEFLNNGTPQASVKKTFANYDGEAFIYDAIFQDSYAFRKQTGNAIKRCCLDGMDPKESLDKLIAGIDAI